MIYCVMADGPGLTQQIRDLLFDSAQEMFANRSEKHSLDCEWCEGYVYTKWKQSSMGFVYGTIFTAHFSSGQGTYKVEYIVRESELKSSEFIKAFVAEPRMPGFSEN